MYVLTELGYVLICLVQEKEFENPKEFRFENPLVEKSESSTRNKNGLVEGLLLFSIQYDIFRNKIKLILLVSIYITT